jgi:hypothetical protein
MFDPAALEAVVQRVLATTPEIPENHRGAFLTVANEQGIRAVIAVKVGDEWTIKADIAHAWHADSKITYGVQVTGTF